MATKQNTAATTANANLPAAISFAAKCPAGYTSGHAMQLVKQPKKAHTGARGNWWQAFVAHHAKHGIQVHGAPAGAGKLVPFGQWAAAMLANPPSTPKNGKLAGQCEPPKGWANWFVRSGYVKLLPCWVPVPPAS